MVPLRRGSWPRRPGHDRWWLESDDHDPSAHEWAANDFGSSRVIVAQGLGSVTSAVATLTVTASGTCLSPAPTGLVGWWPGDGNANDIAGADNGTFVGGATATAAGIVGATFTLDGTNG